MEISSTGCLPEIDTVQAVTGKAKPLAKNNDGSAELQREVDDLAELTYVQDEESVPF